MTQPVMRCRTGGVETEQRWERLHAAETRMDQHIGQTGRALAALRMRVVMLDQVDEVEELVAAVRADVRAACAEPQTTPPAPR